MQKEKNLRDDDVVGLDKDLRYISAENYRKTMEECSSQYKWSIKLGFFIMFFLGLIFGGYVGFMIGMTNAPDYLGMFGG